MKIADYILEYLSQNGSVKIPEFGEFVLEDVGAKFDSESNRFLPPAKLITFHSDYLTDDSGFAKFIAQKEQTDAQSAEIEIKKTTSFWKQKLAAGEELQIEGIGTFFQGESLRFTGNRIEKSTPDYYGLEEIALNDIKRSGKAVVAQDEVQKEGKDYKFSRSILWIFLIIIPVAALAYLAITQQERIFGKKSFDDLSVKTSTHRIPKDTLKTDSFHQKAIDSLKNDSISRLNAVPVPVKKKSKLPKKKTYRKYAKKKWKK